MNLIRKKKKTGRELLRQMGNAAGEAPVQSKASLSVSGNSGISSGKSPWGSQKSALEKSPEGLSTAGKMQYNNSGRLRVPPAVTAPAQDAVDTGENIDSLLRQINSRGPDISLESVISDESYADYFYVRKDKISEVMGN